MIVHGVGSPLQVGKHYLAGRVVINGVLGTRITQIFFNQVTDRRIARRISRRTGMKFVFKQRRAAFLGQPNL